jgi:FkbM family methyltransferase|tara:strand:- start:273 stop:893 length:621 start_codon:yes stop_codon:yes gene_type:complete
MIKVNGFWVPENDKHIEEWKSGSSFTQNKCLDEFIKICKKEDLKFNHILDIGAWVGTWTCAMNEFCGRIVAFEPDPVHYECLVKNVPADVETHQLAVGNDTKMISLSDDNFTQAKRIIGDGNIPMVTIDGLGLSDVDMIKIDVEGYEMEVLKGAEKTLENIKYLMIELNNNTKKYGSSNVEIEKYLRKKGFRVKVKIWPDVVWSKK